MQRGVISDLKYSADITAVGESRLYQINDGVCIWLMGQGTIDGPKLFVGDDEVTNPLLLRRLQESAYRLESTIYILNSNALIKINKDTLVPFHKFRKVQGMFLDKEYIFSGGKFIDSYNKL